MPLVFRCAACGAPLWRVEGKARYGGIPSIRQVIEKLGGRCPVCGAPLSIVPRRVRVTGVGG